MDMLKKVGRQAWLYVVLTYVGTFIVDAIIIKSGASTYKADNLVFLRMWMPGLVGVALSIRFRNREMWSLFKKVPPLKWSALAYVLPIAIGLISVGLLFLTGQSRFELNPEFVQKYGSVGSALVKALVFAPTVSFLIACVACLGEELGWRGYLFPATANLQPMQRRFLNGAIWSIYHWPLILFSDYATSSHPAYSVIMFSIFVVAQGILICWIQEHSKSIWTSVFCHASHNLWIIGIIPLFYTKNEYTPYLIGEGGLMLAVAYPIGVWLVLRYLSGRKSA